MTRLKNKIKRFLKNHQEQLEQLTKGEDFEQIKAFMKELQIIQEHILELAKEVPRLTDKLPTERHKPVRYLEPLQNRIRSSLKKRWIWFKYYFRAFLILIAKFIPLLGLITLFTYITFVSFKVNLFTILTYPPYYVVGSIILIILIIIGTSAFYYLLIMILKRRYLKYRETKAQKKEDND